MNKLRQAAIQYSEMGYKVFPLTPGQKFPLKGSHGCLDASDDYETIDAWWEKHPNANIGLSTESLVVIDPDAIDGKPNPWLDDKDLSDCVSVQATPRGGHHFIFSQPEGKGYRNTEGSGQRPALAPHVDTRANGGYIVAAPSIVNGKPYRWIEGFNLCDRSELPTPPGWLTRQLDIIHKGDRVLFSPDSTSKSHNNAHNGHISHNDTKGDYRNPQSPKRGQGTFMPPLPLKSDRIYPSNHPGQSNRPDPTSHSGHTHPGPQKILQGGRNSTLASLAGSMRWRGMTPSEIAAALHQVNADRCNPQLPKAEVESIARSIGSKPAGNFKVNGNTQNNHPGPMPNDTLLPVPAYRSADVQYIPFPTAVLPEPARSFVDETAEAIGCDPAYVALPMLSAVAGAIGNARCIQLKRGWTEPAVVWTGIIGQSGTMKTPAFKASLKHLQKRQTEAITLWQTQMADWQREVDRCGKNDTPPDKPQCKRFCVEDTTIEALVDRLQYNPRGLLVNRDELAAWLGSFNAYKKSGSDEGHWLSMFSAGGVTVDRKTGQQTTHVPRAAVSITGGIQPGVLKRTFTPEHKDSGLLARFLLAMPPRRQKQWTDSELSHDTETRYNRMIDNLLALQMGHNISGDTNPVPVKLSPTAQEQFIAYVNTHNAGALDMQDDQAASWTKLEAYAARLTLLFHLVRVADNDKAIQSPATIDTYSLTTALTLTDWLKAETMRIYNSFDVESKRDLYETLVRRIDEKGGRITPREWQKSRSKKTVADARAELQKLVDAGYGKFENTNNIGKGRPSEIFASFCQCSF